MNESEREIPITFEDAPTEPELEAASPQSLRDDLERVLILLNALRTDRK